MKLYYFGIAGKGEAIRLALAYTNTEFEDYKFSGFEEFTEMKNSGKLMFGQVPALEVNSKQHDRKSMLTQSAAILRLIGKICPDSELIPKCPFQAAKVDAIVDQEADAFQAYRVVNYNKRFGLGDLDDETLKKIKAKINAEVIPSHLELLEKQIVAGGTDWLAGTSKPSIADFQWAGILPALQKGSGWTGDTTVFNKDKYPKLSAMVDRFYELPAIKKWYETNEYKIWF